MQNQFSFRTLNIIYFAMLMGMVIFLTIVVVALKPQNAPGFNTIIYVFYAVSFASVFFSSFMYRIRSNAAQTLNSLQEKLAHYRSGVIVRLALVEGPIIFGIVLYLLSGKFLVLALTFMLLVYFVFIRPTKDKAIKDLNLKGEEARQAREMS